MGDLSLHRRTTAALLAAFTVAACNDDIDLDRGWEAQVDTVTLYTVDRPEYQGLPSAYDILNRRTMRVEDPSASGNWDFALTGSVDGPLSMTPLGAFFGVTTNAAIATIENRTFEELASAPSDSAAYVDDGPVALADGVVYVIRSRESSGCMSFAKLEPLDIDQAAGILTFHVMVNPSCNDRALIPPEVD